MKESIKQKLIDQPGRSALIDGLTKARSVSFALVDMKGGLVAYNPEFAKEVGWSEAVDDISKVGTPLGDKLADASKTAAWQGISVKTTWTEGGWSEFEVLPAGDEGAIILGHIAVPRSCLVADQDRQTLYTNLFDENPLPMLMVEPHSKVILDANRAASELLGLRRDILLSMMMDQTGLSTGRELSSVPPGMGRRMRLPYSPRNPRKERRMVEVMLDRVEMGGLEQVIVTVLDFERSED